MRQTTDRCFALSAIGRVMYWYFGKFLFKSQGTLIEIKIKITLLSLAAAAFHGINVNCLSGTYSYSVSLFQMQSHLHC